MGTNLKGAVPTPHPDWDQDEVWTWIQNKIKTGDYTALINWLYADSPTPRMQSRITLINKAAIDLCIICQRHHDETEAAWQTFQRAVTQEKELGNNLSTLLQAFMAENKLTASSILLKTQEHDKRPFSPTIQSPPESIQPKLWQRIQNFFTQLQHEPDSTLPDSPTQIEATLSLLKSKPLRQEEPVDMPPPQKQKEKNPSLTIYLFGSFRVYQDDMPVLDWTNNKSGSLFKFLLSRRQEKIAKEVLMDTFWPNATPDAARNNLNVTIYNLRKTLRDGYHDFSHILFRDGYYLLNPEMHIWVDVDAFEKNIQEAREHERNGRFDQAIQNYHAAEDLYQGEYLSEDRYEDWPIAKRQTYQERYLELLDTLSRYYFEKSELTMSIRLCRQILDVDSCQEETHRQLMTSFAQLGQPHLALRQFHQLSECLKEELNVKPSEETIQLLNKIRNHEDL